MRDSARVCTIARILVWTGVVKIFLVVVASLMVGWAHADTARGRAVAEAEYAASHGYGDLEVEIEMELRSANGKASIRKLRLRQMEIAGNRVKTLAIFDLPKAIADTALLTWSNPDTEDDQWLFLPSLKRVKKIASKDRSGPFVGSTFAYEDFADYQIDEFDYLWISQEACGQLTCDVVERKRKDRFSGYSRELVFIDTTDHRIRRIEYFDRDDKPLKTLAAADFATYPVGSRKFVQPHQSTMSNLQTGRSTILRWSPYRFGTGLKEARDFSTNALRSVR